jgi:hypothetical protein
MSEQRSLVPDPPRVDLALLQSARYTIRAISDVGPVLVHYDPVQRVGAVFFLAIETWVVHSPISFADFAECLRGQEIVLPDSGEKAAWVATCSRLPTAANLN